MSLELNSCVLIDYRLWAAKSEGRQWAVPLVAGRFSDSETSWVLAGAQRAVFCAVRVADFLAQGAGWGAFPGRRGRVGVADSDGARSPSPLPEPSILIHFSSAAVCTLSSWRKLRRPSVFRLVSGAG